MTSIASALKQLKGIWRGEGEGQFPTIDAFRYRETLRFDANETEPLVFFEQKTWMLSEKGDIVEPLHWESGFLIVKEDGSIDLLNAQNSNRVEVLTGEMTVLENGFELALKSVVHAHDPQMRISARAFKLVNNTLNYTVAMGTDKVADLTPHLSCTLIRKR